MCWDAQYIYNNVIYTQYLQTFNTQRLLISQGNNTGRSQNALQYLSSLVFLPSGLILCCSTNKQAWICPDVSGCCCTNQRVCNQSATYRSRNDSACGTICIQCRMWPVPDIRLMRRNELNMAGAVLLKSFKDKGKKKYMISHCGLNKPATSGNDNAVRVILPVLHFYSFRSLWCFVSLSLWSRGGSKFCINQHLLSKKHYRGGSRWGGGGAPQGVRGRKHERTLNSSDKKWKTSEQSVWSGGWTTCPP